MTPEQRVKVSICDYLSLRHDVFFWEQHNGAIFNTERKVFYKKRRYQLNGVADILGIHKTTGRFIAIEVKSRTGILSDSQKIFLQNIKESGGIAIVARSIADVIDGLRANNVT